MGPSGDIDVLNFRNGLIAAALTIATAASAGAAQATAILGLYNTGVSDAGVATSGVAADLHWTLNGGDAFTSGGNGVWPVAGPWVAEDGVSRWLTPTRVAGESVDPLVNGFYTYKLDFDLTAAEAAGASFTGQFAADNGVYEIWLNTTTLGGSVFGGNPGGFDHFTTFSAASNAFQAGTNSLTFKVVNYGQSSGNPSGLIVKFGESAVGVVPEPATWAMMITGFGMAGVALRRRRQGFAAA